MLFFVFTCWLLAQSSPQFTVSQKKEDIFQTLPFQHMEGYVLVKWSSSLCSSFEKQVKIQAEIHLYHFCILKCIAICIPRYKEPVTKRNVIGPVYEFYCSNRQIFWQYITAHTLGKNFFWSIIWNLTKLQQL